MSDWGLPQWIFAVWTVLMIVGGLLVNGAPPSREPTNGAFVVFVFSAQALVLWLGGFWK